MHLKSWCDEGQHLQQALSLKELTEFEKIINKISYMKMMMSYIIIKIVLVR